MRHAFGAGASVLGAGLLTPPEAFGAGLPTPPCEPAQATLVLIGPEGGFTDDEFSFAVAFGATPVNLGPFILRIETAAVAVAAAWRQVV